jgi:hypothetical protein
MKDVKKAFKDLRKEAQQDCESIKIDEMYKGFEISTLRIKWLNKHYDWLEYLIEKEDEKTQLYNNVKMNIDETSPRQYSNEELKKEVYGDKSYREFSTTCKLISSITDYCKNVVENIDKKGWEIKNQLDFIRYSEGHQ